MKLRRLMREWIPRLILGGAFVFAAVLKIADPAKFALDLANYRVLPPEAINLVAVLLPWIEFVAGLFILIGIWLKGASVVITALLVMFLAVVFSALGRGLNIECGCFGTIGGRHVGLTTLALDSVLLYLAVVLTRQPEKGWKDPATLETSPMHPHLSS